MSTEPNVSGTGAGPEIAGQRPPGPTTESDVEERADVAEDRRRQRELDDGELGGEA
jgi:hypothetical protein